MDPGVSMKIFILVDFEGASGVFHESQVFGHRQKEGLRGLYSDVNAILDGARDGGADELVVGDWHAFGGNLELSFLSQKCQLTQYADRGILHKERFDMAFFVGAHARAGLDAVLAHTEEFFIANVWINHQPVGETTLVYHYLNDLGIPVGGVIGAGEALDEIRHNPNGTALVETKRGFAGPEPAQTYPLIRQAVQMAVTGRRAKQVKSQKPLFVVEYRHKHNYRPEKLPTGITVLDGKQICMDGPSIGGCYELLMQLLCGETQ